MRKMTFKRRLTYATFRPLIKLFLYFLWITCRVKTIINDETTQRLIDKGEPIIPCYWHQMHIFGLWYMKKLAKRGLKVGFLISPSVDGEIPAQIIQGWGMTAIRGSSTRTGAKALRDMYNIIVKDKVSPLTTSDGPTGPVHEFKSGAVTLAQLTQAPMLPIAYAASRYWQLKSWDGFIVPKPFSTITIAVGQPHYIDKQLKSDDLEEKRKMMEKEMMACIDIAKENLASFTEADIPQQ